VNRREALPLTGSLGEQALVTLLLAQSHDTRYSPIAQG